MIAISIHLDINMLFENLMTLITLYTNHCFAKISYKIIKNLYRLGELLSSNDSAVKHCENLVTINSFLCLNYYKPTKYYNREESFYIILNNINKLHILL